MRIKYRPTKKPKSINDRFIQCMWDIIEYHRANEGELVSVEHFGKTLGLFRNAFTRYYHTHYYVPTKILEIAFEKYRMNPTYIFLGEGERFLDKTFQKNALDKKIKELTELKKKLK